MHRTGANRAVSSVGLERLPYKQEVTGSNPVPPTKREVTPVLSLSFPLDFLYQKHYTAPNYVRWIPDFRVRVGSVSK